MSNNRVVAGLVSFCACISLTHVARGDGCPGAAGQSQGPDVMVATLSGPSNFASVGTREALTFGADACNLGSQQVSWVACPDTTHPVFGGNLYKWYTLN